MSDHGDTKEFRFFDIPAPNLPKFEERWEKLVRRANKLGVIPPTYAIVKEETKPFRARKEVWDTVLQEVTVQYVDVPMVYHRIVIDHPEVKVPGGWEFVASLEHTEEGNITHNIGGKDLPAKYRDCDAWCDHCQLRRNRKDTFVVVDPNLEYKQIGRNCLAEYLGMDGTMYANAAEIYYTASELAGASIGGDYGGGSGPTYDYLEPYLAHVAEVISIEGWVSRSVARQQEKASTSDIAYTHMHPPPFQRRKDRLYDKPSDKSEETAKLAAAWCESIADSEVDASEYLHNIRVIARRGVIGARQYGFAASIVFAYQRHLVDQATKARQAQQAATSQHVGEVKKRQNFTVVVEKVLAFDGNYGVKHLHLMSDMQGNRLIWWSTSGVLDTGKPMVIKGTVKAHSERQGVKQTELSRVQEVTE